MAQSRNEKNLILKIGLVPMLNIYCYDRHHFKLSIDLVEVNTANG